MIKLIAFAVFDQKAEAFTQPFFLPTKQIAVRTFADCCNDKNHAFGRHPADYTLFHVGHFDTQSGQLVPLQRGLEAMHVGITLVKNEKDERQLELVQTNDKPTAA